MPSSKAYLKTINGPDAELIYNEIISYSGANKIAKQTEKEFKKRIRNAKFNKWKERLHV